MSIIRDKKVKYFQFCEFYNPQHNLGRTANAVALGLAPDPCCGVEH